MPPNPNARRSRPVIRSMAVLSLSLSACVLGNDSDPPVLSVDLLWDRAPDDRFSAGDCDSAGVVYESWQLEQGGEVIAKSDDPNEPCKPGFDFVDIGQGDYTLTIDGFDADQNMLWSSVCDGLDLDRFDALYQCKVLQPAAQ
ncbi:MAG TPA: hypothetical protein VGI70_12410 [Polyangiales bacterium]